ncbi:MAG: glycosyltransferase family 4 protein [Candidatus Eremiobacteraeota bacterium]|nr:glycosyltransferase family 4 protein [Candidatus Eremiobacteraeota bacterium]MBV9700186.1 glycosyltransferase family 4 protein [Candidatus Eremiobacteraeota bacterium]
MKALFVSHFYPPEPGAASARIASFVDALTRAGHDVTVLTNFPSFPRGRFFEVGRPPVRVERSGTTRIVRVFSLLLPGMRGERLIHWASAALSASLYALLARARYDLVIVSSPPLTTAIPALVAAWRHGARLIVDVRDVFPDIAIAMGAWRRESLLARAVESFVCALYRRADLVVAVTPTAIEQIGRRGVARSRLFLARNAAAPTSVARSANGRPKPFTAIYAGNLGVATDVDLLADAAARVAGDNITIEIVGDGAQRPHLEGRVRKEKVHNLALQGSMPRDEALERIANADVSIIPLRKGIQESVPTKLYDSFSVGCPVIVAAEGEAQREGATLGAVCTAPADADALARALRQLAQLDRVALRAIGEAGKAKLAERADRAGVMDELVARIAAC